MMKHWVNAQDGRPPYPSRKEIKELALKANLTTQSVRYWMSNYRKRRC